MNQTLAHLLTVRDSVQIRACQYTFLGWNWGWQLASDLPSSRECIPILGNWKWWGILSSDQYSLPMYFSWVKSPFESQTAMCLQPAVSQGKGIWTSLQSLRPKSSWKLSNCHQHEKGKGPMLLEVWCLSIPSWGSRWPHGFQPATEKIGRGEIKNFQHLGKPTSCSCQH